MKLFKAQYQNKRIIITGHTGFKGSWLTAWLLMIGSEIIGISNNIPTEPSNYKILKLKNRIKEYFFDISDEKKLYEVVNKHKPHYIFHLAAQSIVLKAINNPYLNYNTNIIGGISILEAARKSNHKMKIIFITSDKVYENREITRGYRENDLLGGKDPYSLSKSLIERIIKNYFEIYLQNKKNICIGICRAGNVIGGGDWAENRIIPDYFKSILNKKKLTIRNPNSTRPWQHVLEPLSGYLTFGALIKRNTNLNGESFNFGPKKNHNYRVKDLLKELNSYELKTKILYEKKSLFHESKLLKLNCYKAEKLLSWKPVLNFKETINFTYEWYYNYIKSNNKKYLDFTMQQIIQYQDKANKKNLKWSK